MYLSDAMIQAAGRGGGGMNRALCYASIVLMEAAG